jgi:MATE family multidrug resistance protein
MTECHAWLAQGTWLALLTSVPMFVVCLIVRALIPVMDFHADVQPLVEDYVSVVIWSTFPLLLYAGFRRYLQGMHVVRPLMIALVTANLVNLVANWALIFGHLGLPALGVAGSAWATVIARVYMMGVLMAAIVMYDRRWGSGIFRMSWRPRMDWLRRLFSLGAPAATQVTLEVGAFAAATVLAGRVDPVSAASHQIAINIAATSFMVPLGVSAAGAVRVGSYVGAGDPRAARVAGWTAVLLGMAFMSAAGVLFVFMPRALIGLFSVDAEVLTLGASLLVVAAVFQLFDGLQGVATGVLRGLGETRIPMLANLVGHWFIGLPLGYTFCFTLQFGVIGLWWGFSTGLIICGMVLLWVWHQRSRDYERAGP